MKGIITVFVGCVGAYLKSTADMIFAMRLDELYKSVERSRGLVLCLCRETYDRVPVAWKCQ